MTLQDIDKSITGWNGRLGAAAQNLVDLQSLPVFQRLAGTNGVPVADLSGETAAAVKPALATVSRMLQYFDLLQHLVIRAEELRRDMPMWGAETRIREIELLLTTPSIHLPSEPIPLDRRSLLSSVENVEKIAPSDLMRLMAEAFEQSKNVIVGVNVAWESLGRKIEEALAEIGSLRSQADATSLSDLDAAARAVEEARAKAERDPLAAQSDFDTAVGQIVARVRAKAAEVKQTRLEVETGFAISKAQLEVLLAVHKEAVSAYADALTKVAVSQPIAAPVDEATVIGLREWLTRLDARYREGTLQPILTGIRNWNKAAEQCVSSERRVLLASRAPLEARAELRGRMDALKAKARARGVAEHNDLCSLAEECRAILYTRPTDLQRAATAVEAYEKQLNAIA